MITFSEIKLIFYVARLKRRQQPLSINDIFLQSAEHELHPKYLHNNCFTDSVVSLIENGSVIIQL